MLYKAWHDNGFVTLYINKSKNKVLTETVTYELEGMAIEGLDRETTVLVKVGPGEEFLIKLVNTCEDKNLRKM